MSLLRGVRSGSDTTHNTTRSDKWEQCDTKHNALKIYSAGENIFQILFLQPMHHRVFSSVSESVCKVFLIFLRKMAQAQQIQSIILKKLWIDGNCDCESDILQNKFTYHDYHKNQGNLHTLRLQQSILGKILVWKLPKKLDIFRKSLCAVYSTNAYFELQPWINLQIAAGLSIRSWINLEEP